MTFEDFFKKPYEERQLIVFSRDVSTPTTQSFFVFLKELKSRIWKHPIKYIFRQWLYSGVSYAVLFHLIKELFSDDKEVTYLPVSYADELTLPKGLLEVCTIYVAHPIDSQNKCYYPISEFHISLHKQKSHELIQILRSLQATHLEIRHIEGSKDVEGLSVDMSVPVDSVKVGIEAGMETKSNRAYDLMWQENHPPSDVKPQLPQNLIWYDYEEDWQFAVEGVLKHGAKSMSFKYSYINDYGINLDLNIAYDKAKI